MLVKISKIVKATISSTRLNPACLPARGERFRQPSCRTTTFILRIWTVGDRRILCGRPRLGLRLTAERLRLRAERLRLTAERLRLTT